MSGPEPSGSIDINAEHVPQGKKKAFFYSLFLLIAVENIGVVNYTDLNVEVLMADTWLHVVPPGKTEARLYRQWLEAGCPDEPLVPWEEEMNFFTAYNMDALHYFTADAQVRQFLDVRNIIRGKDLSSTPAGLKSSSLPFEQHLFTKLKLLMAQREHLSERLTRLLRVLSIYDDVILDIQEGRF